MKCATVRSTRSFIVCLALLLLACQSVPGPISSNAAERIRTHLQDGVSAGFSGAVLVAVDDQILLNAGFGLAVKDTAIPFTPNTVFSIGSVTKQFTATAILLLTESHALSLDDTIDRFFMNLPVDKQNITVHQLLTHSSGLPPAIGGDFDQVSTEVFFKDLFGTPLLFEPGTRHSYSNPGYSVLARIVELVAEQGFESFLAENLFDPAGMQQTGYVLPAWNADAIAHGYTMNVLNRGSRIDRYREDGGVSWHLKGNGGVHSTQNDMHLWLQALEDNTVLTPAMTKLLTTPYIAEQDGGASYYAYGWATYESDRGTQVIRHNGGNGAEFHEIIWIPEERAVIIFATNAASPEVEQTSVIERMLFDPSFQPEPIEKNVYQFVLDFLKDHSPTDASLLEATLTSRYASELSEPATLNRLGYLAVRSDQDIDWVVSLFKFNTKLFPDNGNVWDSLGEGYQRAGRDGDAMAAFARAVSLGHSESQAKLDAMRSNSE